MFGGCEEVYHFVDPLKLIITLRVIKLKFPAIKSYTLPYYAQV